MIDTLCVFISFASVTFGVFGTLVVFIAIKAFFFPNIRYDEITSSLSFFRQTHEMISKKYKTDNNINTWLHWIKNNRINTYSNDGWNISVVLQYQMIPIDKELCNVCRKIRLCVTCNTAPEYMAVCSKCVKKVPKFIRV